MLLGVGPFIAYSEERGKNSRTGGTLSNALAAVNVGKSKSVSPRTTDEKSFCLSVPFYFFLAMASLLLLPPLFFASIELESAVASSR